MRRYGVRPRGSPQLSCVRRLIRPSTTSQHQVLHGVQGHWLGGARSARATRAGPRESAQEGLRPARHRIPGANLSRALRAARAIDGRSRVGRVAHRLCIKGAEQRSWVLQYA